MMQRIGCDLLLKASRGYERAHVKQNNYTPIRIGTLRRQALTGLGVSCALHNVRDTPSAAGYIQRLSRECNAAYVTA